MSGNVAAMPKPPRLREVVAKSLAQVKRDSTIPARLHDDTNLLADVGLDSLELTELMLQLEDELAIELELGALERQHLQRLSSFEDFLSR
jgi:acyl carrier protein